MGKVIQFRKYGHQCYRRTRRWGGGVVKDAVCPLCVAHKQKVEAFTQKSRERGRIRRMIVKEKP